MRAPTVFSNRNWWLLDMLRLILICSFLPASLSQYNGIAKRRDQPSLHHYSLQQPHLNQQHHHPSPLQHPPNNLQQQQQLTNQQQQHHTLQLQLLSTPQQHQPPSPQPKREPTHYQYSSFGSQSDSTESAPVSIGPFTRNPHVSFPNNNNRLDDRNYGPRDYEAGPRNYRYQEGFRSGVAGESFGKPWRPEGRPRRPRKEGRARANMLYDGKGGYRELPKPRSPRIVKYIADKNGFAVREDLVKPLKDLERATRQESRRRVVTAAGPPHLMSQVVTSAIRVTGQQQQGGEGKFLPQVFDLKLGGGKRRREYVL